MASPTVQINVGLAGLASPTLDVYPFQNDTALATGIALTEETNRQGVYTSSAAGLTGLSASGTYYLQVISGGNIQWTGWVRLLDISMLWSAVEELPDPLPIDILGSVVANGINTPSLFEVALPAGVVAVTQLKGGVVQFLTGTLAGQFQELSSQTGGSPNIASMSGPFTATPTGGDVFRILPGTLMRGTNSASTHAPAAVKTEIEQAGSHLALIKAKTDAMAFTGNDIHATLDGEEVDLGKIKGQADEATALQENLEQIPDGEVDTLSAANIFIAANSQFITGNPNHWVGRDIYWLTGAMAGSRQTISASVEVSGPRVQFTLSSNMPGAGPTAGDRFRIV